VDSYYNRRDTARRRGAYFEKYFKTTQSLTADMCDNEKDKAGSLLDLEQGFLYAYRSSE
jgi:hypothetical protein